MGVELSIKTKDKVEGEVECLENERGVEAKDDQSQRRREVWRILSNATSGSALH